MTEADAQEAETDSLETDKQERSEYDWANFDIIELADLLVNEKKAGMSNDSIFADFFKRCGIEYFEEPMSCYENVKTRGFVDEKRVAVSYYDNSEDGEMHHAIRIFFHYKDKYRLHWMAKQLISYGMKDLDPNSKNIKLQGKGLKGYGEYGFFEIRY